MQTTARLALLLAAGALCACASEPKQVQTVEGPAPAPITGRWLPDTSPFFVDVDRSTSVVFPEGDGETLVSIADAYDESLREWRTVVYVVRIPEDTPTGATINIAPELPAEGWAQITGGRVATVHDLRGTLLIERADATEYEGSLLLESADARAGVPPIELRGRWTLLERPPVATGPGIDTVSGVAHRPADPEDPVRRKTAAVWPWEELFGGKPFEEPID